MSAALARPFHRPSRLEASELLAVGWGLLFAVVHAYWALGGRLGIPADTAPMSERPVFLAYDIVSGVLCLAGAVVVWRLAQQRADAGSGDELLVRLLAVGTWALVIRAGLGVVTSVALAVAGDLTFTVLYDLWFIVGAVAFWRARR